MQQWLVKVLILSICLLSVVQAEPAAQHTLSVPHQSKIWTTLNPDQAKKSGQLLMNLPNGLHQLSPKQPNGPLIILVHGYASKGYEWVYAAKQLYNRGEVYFYRWNWEQCPQEGGVALMKKILRLQKRQSHRTLEVFGHSYGGVISAIAAAQYQGHQKLRIHSIAAPLAGHKQLEARCQPSISTLTKPLMDSKRAHQVKVTQWKTIRELDGAFKDLDYDPQNVEWPDKVILLPRSYKGHRLGHNWSISAVVDQLLSL